MIMLAEFKQFPEIHKLVELTDPGRAFKLTRSFELTQVAPAQTEVLFTFSVTVLIFEISPVFKHCAPTQRVLLLEFKQIDPTQNLVLTL